MGFEHTDSNPFVDDEGTERPFDGDSLGVVDYVRLAERSDIASVRSIVTMTDGGHPENTAESDQARLQQLFEDVTGTTTVVDSQQTRERERSVVDSEEQSLSATVAGVVREDGLDDTLAEPDPEKQG